MYVLCNTHLFKKHASRSTSNKAVITHCKIFFVLNSKNDENIENSRFQLLISQLKFKAGLT